MKLKIFSLFFSAILLTSFVAAVDVFMSNDQTINNGESATFTCDIDPDLFYYVTYEIILKGDNLYKVITSGQINSIFAQIPATITPNDYNDPGTYTVVCSATEYGNTDSDAAKLIVKDGTITYRHENSCDNYGWDNARTCGGCKPRPANNCVAYDDSQPYHWHDSNEIWQCDYAPDQNSIYHFVENCNNYDGWHDSADTRWIETGQCTEKEQKKQEYRDYYCQESNLNANCLYTITNTNWVDTGITRNKADGTDCNDALWCTLNDKCSAGVCVGGTSRICPDNNECTSDACNENLDRCENTNLPQGTSCGIARNCHGDYCNGYFAEFYPNDGHDYCNGQGTCLAYSCAMEDKYCTDNDETDGVNTLECDAECDQNSDCNDYNSNTIDICNINTCVCEHNTTPYCGNNVINPGEQCELPNTNNNFYCTQTTQECSGNKLGTRDNYGNCNSGCNCAYDSFTYQCVKNQCGAQCDTNDDCGYTECDFLDGCQGKDYYDYSDVYNSCFEDCTCEISICGAPTIYYNDQRCIEIECQTDNDCDNLDKDYCLGDIVKHDEGICVNNQCQVQTTTTADCNSLNDYYCDGTKIKYMDYTCHDATCVSSSATLIEECSDGLYCNGQETCHDHHEMPMCMPGEQIVCSDELYCTVNEFCDEYLDSCSYDNRDCSSNNLPEIATCNNNPDNNPYTWDYMATFTSSCNEELNVCTTSSATLTHSCDMSKCDAECEQDSDCNDGNQWTNDYCENCICYSNYIPHCGDNNADSGEECDGSDLNEKTCPNLYEVISNVIVYFVDGSLSCNQNCMFDYSQCILPECADGIDNDKDGLIDYPADPGCGAYYDNDESNPMPECNDGRDNDGDGLIDMEDPDCESKFDNNEKADKLIPELFVKRISILNEEVINAGDNMLLIVTLYNDGDSNLKNIKITATIPELGMVMQTGRFDMKKNKEVTKSILLEDIPKEAQPGEYDIRITVSNDILARVIHRPFKILK